MRRLLAVAAVAAAAFGYAGPATAAYDCHGYENTNGQGIGVCAGSWCPDKCFIVASTYCHGFDPKWCGAVDGLGSPPGGVR